MNMNSSVRACFSLHQKNFWIEPICVPTNHYLDNNEKAASVSRRVRHESEPTITTHRGQAGQLASRLLTHRCRPAIVVYRSAHLDRTEVVDSTVGCSASNAAGTMPVRVPSGCIIYSVYDSDNVETAMINHLLYYHSILSSLL